MFGNKCINDEFRFIGDLSEVTKVISEKCGFCELDPQEYFELHGLINRKMKEIGELENEKELKNKEINDKNEKIKRLEEKVKILSNQGI